MSWFSAGLDALKDVKGAVTKVSDRVSKAVPLDREILAKLTLNTDDMKAQRQQFGEEALRKAQVKDMLAGMFPWETRDPEREILVDECREAILALSSKEETFFGPYQVPPLPVRTVAPDESVKSEVENDDDDDSQSKKSDDDDEDDGQQTSQKPTPESLEKLSKLEPLPPLLDEFDLDSHVGLIQKLLAVDPQLVKVQSNLSGGGARELAFWRNYFFHCAYTRYEAGLSIDEIWSFDPEGSQTAAAVAAEDSAATPAAPAEQSKDDKAVETESMPTDAPADSDNGDDTEQSQDSAGNATPAMVGGTSAANSLAMSNEFEFVSNDGNSDGDGDDIGTSNDPELDELEAEIARELED